MLLLLSSVQVCANGNPYQIWVPYVDSPVISYDGRIDPGEWAGAGRYDISDIHGFEGPPDDTGSVLLYASHDESYFRIAVVNRVDSVLSGGDIITLWVDDNNNDTLEDFVEGYYELKHYPGGDSLFFFPYLGFPFSTGFDIAIGNTDGPVSFEAAIALGETGYYINASTLGAFGAWMGVRDGDGFDLDGVWPPVGGSGTLESYGDVYLADSGETPPPGPPGNVVVSVNRPDTVVVEWDNPVFDMIGDSLEWLDSVRVYRNGMWITSIPTTSIGEHMVHIDTDVQLARDYAYRLSAVDVQGRESPLTESRYAVPGYLYYSSDLEADGGGWKPAVDSTWEWGVPQNVGPGRAHSGSKCWATNIDDYYASNARWRLTGPATSIEDLSLSRVVFCLYHFYRTEAWFDGGNVKISTDNGASWEMIEPVSGYPIDGIAGLGNEPGFSGFSGMWDHSVFDLSAYVGGTVRLRFDFGSDGSTEFPGWYVDDIAVVATNPGVGVREVTNSGGGGVNTTTLATRPNPSRGTVTISYGLSGPEKVGLCIYDVAGRLVARLSEGNQTAGYHSLVWHGTDVAGVSVPSGVYVCTLNAGASFKAEKFILVR
ncbi:MAG: FlgD immunoglobulin-like domain containing protein, partial [bacterium]